MKPSSGHPQDFESLGLAGSLVATLTALGYEEPTPVQREAIPALLEGHDMLGQAATGTGKTAAFALPMLQHIAETTEEERGHTSGLILVPTRELAMQVAEAIHKYAKGTGISVVPLYGGAPMDLQIRALKRGADVVVATPGRALDHINRRTLKLQKVRIVTLDEADEMLDMGFAEDLEAILSSTPAERQTALFSATMPPRIAAIAVRHLRDPVRLTIARETTASGKLARVRQVAFIVARAQKSQALRRVLDMETPSSAIVFCRTRLEVDELVQTLTAHGYRAQALHGGMQQRERDRVMSLFRAAKVDLLVATDVAARGLDIEHLSHVVNYDVPSAPEAYVHRIGRTGRIGRSGVAITFAEPREHRLLRNIEAFTKQKIEVQNVPTVADLRSRRLDVMRASLRERLLAGDSADVRVVVEALSDEFDVMQIATAAVKMALEAQDGDASEVKEIPAAKPEFERPEPASRFGKANRREGAPRFEKPTRAGAAARVEKPTRAEGAATFEKPTRAEGAAPVEKPTRAEGAAPVVKPTRAEGAATFVKPIRREKAPHAEKAPRTEKSAPVAMTRIYVGAGRAAGMRPGDLVGAIAGEAGVDSRVIGSIEIADRFSIVEVEKGLADDIIAALRRTKIRGRKVAVNFDRGPKS